MASRSSNDQRDPETYAIIGAGIEVHRELGPGFRETAYHEALALALAERGIPFRSEVRLEIRFKGRVLRTHFRADFLCYDEVVVEIKALRELGGPDEAQILNYLRAIGRAKGLLLNFGAKSLEYRRFIRSQGRRPNPR